jgi:hypothetical protein
VIVVDPSRSLGAICAGRQWAFGERELWPAIPLRRQTRLPGGLILLIRSRRGKDTGKGKKTVLEDLQAVLRRIEHWHQGSVAHLKLTVIDSEGRKMTVV